MVVRADSVQDQGLRGGVDLVAVEDGDAAEAVGSRTRTRSQTMLLRGVHREHHCDCEHDASKEQCAVTLSTAKEAAGKLGGAGRAVKKKKKKKKAAVKKKGKCAGTAEEAAGKLGGVGRAGNKKTEARLEAWTEFRGVSRLQSGKYGAKIRRSKGVVMWLGTFDTAEEAAGAYDAAAVELDGARAATNLQPSGQAAGSAMVKAKKRAAARPDARTGFRGVHRLVSGRYSARIWDSKGKATLRLGIFRTAEEAARAYDAAAVKQRGAAAITNFEQPPTADDGGVSSMDLSDGFPELPAVDFSESLIPGPQMDDLRTDLPPAEWLLVHEFLRDFAGVVA